MPLRTFKTVGKVSDHYNTTLVGQIETWKRGDQSNRSRALSRAENEMARRCGGVDPAIADAVMRHGLSPHHHLLRILLFSAITASNLSI
jgi:hypothetical protein